MAGAMEVYICRNWQPLEEAEIEFSRHIETREHAKLDAEEVCRQDPKVRKVAYYSITESGSWRLVFAYENPEFYPDREICRPKQVPPRITAARMRSKRQEASLWSRFVGIFVATRHSLRADGLG